MRWPQNSPNVLLQGERNIVFLNLESSSQNMSPFPFSAKNQKQETSKNNAPWNSWRNQKLPSPPLCPTAPQCPTATPWLEDTFSEVSPHLWSGVKRQTENFCNPKASKKSAIVDSFWTKFVNNGKNRRKEEFHFSLGGYPPIYKLVLGNSCLRTPPPSQGFFNTPEYLCTAVIACTQ